MNAERCQEPTSVIVCGVDGSGESRRVAGVAAELSGSLGAQLVLVTVVSVAQSPAATPAEQLEHDECVARRALLQELKQEEGLTEADDVVGVGSPAGALVEVAIARGAELLVVGTRGRGPLKAAVLGSVSHDVMEKAPCPVVVVPSRHGA